MNKLRVAIIGGGPAGLSAALWLKNLGMIPIVIEKEAKTGGMQNFNFLTNDWVLGQVSATGVEVAERFHQHIVDEAIDFRLQHKLIELSVENGAYHLCFQSADSLACDAIILANGTRYVGREILPECDGVNQHQIIEGPHSFVDLDNCRRQQVVIVGAGDNAFENALMLLQQECQVVMVSRSKPKAQKRFIDQVLGHASFTLIEGACIESVAQYRDKLQLLVAGHVKHEVLADRLHILAGYRSNLTSVSALIEKGLSNFFDCDENNFLIVDEKGRTSMRHIYAAGDICNTQFPCVVSAIAAGALAAKTLAEDLS
jgi:thioredoxin reductase